MIGRQRSIHTAVLVAVALTGAACDEDRGPANRQDPAWMWDAEMAAGTTLYVRDMRGDITVTPAADNQVHVRASMEWRSGNPMESVHFTGERSGNDVLICAIWSKGTCTAEKYESSMKSGGGTDAKVHFKIEVPAGVKVDIVGIDGDITAQASAPVDARTANGDIVIVTAVGPARGETMNGSVDLRMSSLAGSDSVVAKTLNGDVFVYLPESPDVMLELGTMTGSVSSEFPVTVTGEPNRRSLRAALGAGTRAVVAKTTNGDASVRRLDAQGRSGTP